MPRNPDLNENASGPAMPTSNTVGGGLAPQPTSVVGTPAPPPENVESTGASTATCMLNPLGPPNMLSFGAITMNIMDLAYSQFLDTDEQIEITDDTSPGTVIFQIPYDPLSKYVNKYIRNLLALHGRYAGDLLFRFQIIGNATFSGTIIIFWSPRKIQSQVVSMAEAQKYMYKVMSIQLNSVEQMPLKDARKDMFYRSTNDPIEDRPHIVCAVCTSVESPLRQGIKIRVRIGSRLAAPLDTKVIPGVQIFQMSDPTVMGNNPSPEDRNLNGMQLHDIFPNMLIEKYYLYLDARGYIKYNCYDSENNYIPFSVNMPVPALTGGIFPSNDNKRLVATNFSQGWVSSDKVRLVLCSHQLPPDIELAISQDPAWVNQCEGDNWLTQFKTQSALKKHLTVYTTRLNSVKLELFKDQASGFGIYVVGQLYMMTSRGLVVTWAFENEVPSNDLKYAAMGGIPNIAGGIPAKLPLNSALGLVTDSSGVLFYPNPWVGCKFSTQGAVIVSSNDETAPSVFNDEIISRYFDMFKPSDDMCFQMDLIDPVSKVRVITLRYFPPARSFVANPADAINFRMYPGDISKLVVSNSGVVPLASSFPITDISNWPKRLPSNIAGIGMSATPNAAVGELMELLGPTEFSFMGTGASDLGALGSSGMNQTLLRGRLLNSTQPSLLDTSTNNIRLSRPLMAPPNSLADEDEELELPQTPSPSTASDVDTQSELSPIQSPVNETNGTEITDENTDTPIAWPLGETNIPRLSTWFFGPNGTQETPESYEIPDHANRPVNFVREGETPTSPPTTNKLTGKMDKLNSLNKQLKFNPTKPLSILEASCLANEKP